MRQGFQSVMTSTKALTVEFNGIICSKATGQERPLIMERTNNKHSGSGYIYLEDVQHIYPGSCLCLMGFSDLKAS